MKKKQVRNEVRQLVANAMRQQKKRGKRLRKKKQGAKFSTTSVPNSFNYSYKNTGRPLQSFRLKHVEMIREVADTSSSAFKILTSFDLNPGVHATFPWLANIAVNFERYKFHSLKFMFLPALGTSTSGKVSFIPEYDAADDNTTLSKVQYASFEGYTEGSIWSKLICPLKPSNMLGGRSSHFIREKGLASDLDIKTYDVGKVLFGSSGYTTFGVIGDIYVEYDVTLYNPQLQDESQTESWQLENVNPSSINTPFEGTLEAVEAGIPVVVESPTKLNINEPGKFLVRIGAEQMSSLTGLLTPTLSDYDLTLAPPTLSLLEGVSTSSFTTLTQGIWNYLIEAPSPFSFNWNGFTGSALNNFVTEFIRVSDRYKYM